MTEPSISSVLVKISDIEHAVSEFARFSEIWETFRPVEQVETLSWDELQESNQIAWGGQPAERAMEGAVEVNEYTYELDELGRTTRVSGELRLDEAMRNPDAQLEAGRADRLSSDDGGHLIAAEFGGSGEWINLVAMDAETNRWGEYRDLEQELKHHLESGQQVYYENNIIWDGEGYRPQAFDIRYTVDGETFGRRIGNPA